MKCCVLLHSKKHRVTETAQKTAAAKRQLTALVPSTLHWVELFTAVPRQKQERVRTGWDLLAVIFLALHVSLGERFLQNDCQEFCQEPKNKNNKNKTKHNQNPLPSQEAEVR